MSNPAYVYKTDNQTIVVVVPTLAEQGVFAASLPEWLSQSDFNLTPVHNPATLREMREVAGNAGVKLKLKSCAHVANCDKFDALDG